MRFTTIDHQQYDEVIIVRVEASWVHGIYRTHESQRFTVIIPANTTIVHLWHDAGGHEEIDSADPESLSEEYRELLKFLEDPS